MNLVKNKINNDHKIFLLIFFITFSIFLFTSHGHRYTPDEYITFDQANRMLNHIPIPNFIPGVTRDNILNLDSSSVWPICHNAILCSPALIGYATSYIPFIFIEQNFHLIPHLVLSDNDFNDRFYIGWRNSLTNEEIFTYLFYGPLIAALSVGTFYCLIRTYSCSRKTSVIVSFLYGFGTLIWAYSDTALNAVPASLFLLLGMLFFRKFSNNKSMVNLVFCGLSLGYGMTIRYELVFFIVILLISLIINLKKDHNAFPLIGFIIPIIFFGCLLMTVNLVRFGSPFEFGYDNEDGFIAGHTTPPQIGIFGILFSPGAGIFLFSPIILTMFISFYDFYKKEKRDLAINLSFFACFLVFFGTYHAWHGFVGWGDRYMVPVMGLLILPLGISLEKRRNKLFKTLVIVFGSIGTFFNFAWLIQDVPWFVWGLMGGNRGLYALGHLGHYDLGINPTVIWTFQHSQLTNAIYLMFSHLQVDLFLFKVMGPLLMFSILATIIIPLSICLIHILRTDSVKTSFKESKTST